VLVAISNLSGESYRDVEGTELLSELARMGHEPDPVALHNLMFRLRDDGGYVTFHASWSSDPAGLTLIRLGEAGRQEVEGWPKSAGISSAEIEVLLRAFQERADDPNVPEPERGKAATAATALRDVGVEATGSVVASWLRSMGIG
jgi:hypothetical protein